VTSMSVTAAADADSPALTALAAARELLDKPMREAVRRLEPSVRNVAAYHLGWVDADGSAGDAHRGKAVRGTLAVLSAEAAGGPASDGIPGALAVEFVHNFSLLHDDVMDGASDGTARPRGPSSAVRPRSWPVTPCWRSRSRHFSVSTRYAPKPRNGLLRRRLSSSSSAKSAIWSSNGAST